MSPISSCSSFFPTRNFGTPKYCGTSLPVTSMGATASLVPRLSTTFFATLRQIPEISRSKERTPASRV